MRGYFVFRPRLQAVAALLLGAWAASAKGGELYITRTNSVERWITNLIEVRMPVNRFVNEFRTNWVTLVRTNVVALEATNWVTRTVTNTVLVEARRTNFAQAYATNWQTVVVVQTNWVAQRLTNVSVVNVAAAASATGVAAPGHTRPETSDPNPAPKQPGALLLEATKTGRPSSSGQTEVQLKVRWADDASAAPVVQQWRIQSEDGAILCFGQAQEFKRELPAGKYQVAAKVQRGPRGPVLAVLGTLTVTPGSALVQQQIAANQ